MLPLQNTVQIFTLISHAQACDGTSLAAATTGCYTALFSWGYSCSLMCSVQHSRSLTQSCYFALIHIGLYGDLLSEWEMWILCVYSQVCATGGKMPCYPMQDKNILWSQRGLECRIRSFSSMCLGWDCCLSTCVCSLWKLEGIHHLFSFDGWHFDTKWDNWSQKRREGQDRYTL